MITIRGWLAVWLYGQSLPFFVSMVIWPAYWFAQVQRLCVVPAVLRAMTRL